MASYVVLEPPESTGMTADAKFVRDGFTFPALVIPVFWMLWHRMWLAAGLTFFAFAALGAIGETEFGTLAWVVSIALAVFLGFEGANLRVASLRRKGWLEAGVVEAQSVEDAETRYLFDAEDGVEHTDGVPPPGLPWSAAPAAAAPSRPTGPALGLMSYPDRR